MTKKAASGRKKKSAASKPVKRKIIPLKKNLDNSSSKDNSGLDIYWAEEEEVGNTGS